MGKKIVVIGGGAAGIFAAIVAASIDPETSVIVLERSKQLLAKVRISGGGRCNVTHACFEPRQLVQSYPRGNKELLGPFHHFQPKDTIEWFSQRGVHLHTEEDGRMFPSTNDSQTIIDCFLKEATRLNVQIQRMCGVSALQKKDQLWEITTSSGEEYLADRVLLATGSQPAGHRLAKALGHHVVEPVPSLFTFNTPASPMLDLAGISLKEVVARLPSLNLQQKGPLLLTHWGFSGPAILKLSAWGARALHACNYSTPLEICWLPQFTPHQLQELLQCHKREHGSMLVKNSFPVPLPRKLWQRLVHLCNIQEDLRWSNLSKSALMNLTNCLLGDIYQINGKTTFKDEFVTCGGVDLTEVHFKTMESRRHAGLYFAGEILNIDGITGGFNFQAAWTGGWLAGHAMTSTTD